MSRSSSLFVAVAAAAATVLGSVMGFAGEAFAQNVRPVSPLPVGDDGLGTDLQTLFDSITLAGKVDAVNDQISAACFTNTAIASSTSTFIFEIAGLAPKNKAGLYKCGDPSTKALLYDGFNDPGDRAVIDFFFPSGDLAVSTRGFAPDYAGPTIDRYYEGFGNMFGFYLETGDGNIFYSDDSLNPGGNPQALIYQGKDDGTILQLPGRAPGDFTDNEFIVAWEDKPYASSDQDFNDLVFGIESIKPKPVPEPGAIVGLLAIGSLGVSQILKRHKQENKN